jgi:F1F0 ATPase subunit 2
MNENEWMRLFLALGIGIGCGLVFFGGLWWTIRKGMGSSAPAAWFLGSFLVRMTIAVTGFYWASYGHWAGVLVCLAGFLGARAFVTRLKTKQLKTINN